LLGDQERAVRFADLCAQGGDGVPGLGEFGDAVAAERDVVGGVPGFHQKAADGE
jgi:hypothetical protein